MICWRPWDLRKCGRVTVVSAKGPLRNLTKIGGFVRGVNTVDGCVNIHADGEEGHPGDLQSVFGLQAGEDG